MHTDFIRIVFHRWKSEFLLREKRERSLLFENEREGCVKLFFINAIEKQMMKKKKNRV